MDGFTIVKESPRVLEKRARAMTPLQKNLLQAAITVYRHHRERGVVTVGSKDTGYLREVVDPLERMGYLATIWSAKDKSDRYKSGPRKGLLRMSVRNVCITKLGRTSYRSLQKIWDKEDAHLRNVSARGKAVAFKGRRTSRLTREKGLS